MGWGAEGMMARNSLLLALCTENGTLSTKKKAYNVSHSPLFPSVPLQGVAINIYMFLTDISKHSRDLQQNLKFLVTAFYTSKNSNILKVQSLTGSEKLKYPELKTFPLMTDAN